MRGSSSQLTSHGDAAGALFDVETLRIEANADALGFQDLPYRLRDVLVLPRDQPGRHFDDGDAAAEAPVHLCELEADVAAADDDQMLGQEIDVHHAAVRQIVDIAEAGDRRHGRRGRRY